MRLLNLLEKHALTLQNEPYKHLAARVVARAAADVVTADERNKIREKVVLHEARRRVADKLRGLERRRVLKSVKAANGRISTRLNNDATVDWFDGALAKWCEWADLNHDAIFARLIDAGMVDPTDADYSRLRQSMKRKDAAA